MPIIPLNKDSSTQQTVSGGVPPTPTTTPAPPTPTTTPAPPTPTTTITKTRIGTKDSPLLIFNPKTGVSDEWVGTLEEYNEQKNIKEIKEIFEPPPQPIENFRNNAEAQEKAQEMSLFLENYTHEDGKKAVDYFIDYTRGEEFNVTKSAARYIKLLSRDKDNPEVQKFIDNYSWLIDEFNSVNPDGKYKYENMGVSENWTLAGDIAKGILFDPFNWALLFFTAGTTLPEKAVAQQVARQGIRQSIRNMATKSYNVGAKGYNAIPKIPFNTRSYLSTTGILGAEGGIYTAIDSHLWQKRYNELGIEGYEEYDPKLTGKSALYGIGFGTLFGFGTTKVVRHLDTKKEKAFKKVKKKESDKFKREVLGEPDPDAPTPEIISVEEAAILNRKERERAGLKNKTQVEDIADFEMRAANESDILSGNVLNRSIDEQGIIITDESLPTAKQRAALHGPPVFKKPKLGGIAKWMDEGFKVFGVPTAARLFQKPTTYSKELGHISKELEKAGIDQGGKAYQLLRLIRNDSLERTFKDKAIDVAFDHDYINRQFSEQVADLAGSWVKPLEDLKFNIEKLARQESRYQDRTGLYLTKKNWKLRDGSLLNDDLYLFLNEGRFKAGVPQSIIKEAAKFRKLYDNIEREAIRSGFVFHKVPNFFPRHLKIGMVSRRGGGIQRYAQQLVDDGEIDTLPKAIKAVNKQLNKLHGDLDPTIGSLGQREYRKLSTYGIKDLFDTDVYAQTWMYANSTAKKIIIKRELGFTEAEQNAKWWKPIFGGKVPKTSADEGLSVVSEHLIARGFAENFVKDISLQKYIKSNFLARQVEEESAPFQELIKQNSRLRSNNSIINNSQKFKFLTVGERKALLNNTLQEEIDNIILNNFNNETFTKVFRDFEGELSEANVNYRGSSRYPDHEETRLKTLVSSMTGQWGRGSKAQEAWSGAVLATQAGNKLGLATISSLPEIWIPLFKANMKVATRALVSTAWEEGFKNVLNLVTGKGRIRSLSRKEMQQHNKMMSNALSEALHAQYGEGLTGLSAKLTYKFYRSIWLDQYTKFVQVYSYNAGKLLIRETLEDLAKMGDEALNKNNSRAVQLRLQINQLGVDVDAGIKWHKAGAKIEDPFYENLKASADRFVNEVVMVPNRENAQKFLLSGHWLGRVAFQLYSYPVAFGNTVVRNAVRDMKLTGGRSAPRTAAGMALMYYTTAFTQGLKTRGRSDEREPEDQFWYVLNTMGLGGPMALPYNIMEGLDWGHNVPKAAMRTLGPTAGGLLVDMLRGETPFTAALFKNTMPYRNVVKTLLPEQLFELDEFLKALEREYILGQGPQTIRFKYQKSKQKFKQEQAMGEQFRQIEKAKKDLSDKRKEIAEGGKVSKDYPVPFAKDNPSERKIDLEGESYAKVAGLFEEEAVEEEEERVPVGIGGILERTK